MKKCLIALAALSLSVASAKTFDINLDSPSTVGNIQLQPGEYRLKVEASKVVFTDVNTGKSFETNTKVENSREKFAYTAVESKKVGGVEHINAIQLQGTRMKLEFNQ